MIGLVVPALWVAWSDARRRIVPNAACAIVAVCGLALQAARAWAPEVLIALPLSSRVAARLLHPAACVTWGAGMLVALTVIELVHRSLAGRVGLGFGDVKYIAAWACVLGWLTLPSLALACLSGAVVALVRRVRTFALGPWLSASFIAALVVLWL